MEAHVRFGGHRTDPPVRKVLERTGRTLDEGGVIELDEAFAAQALAVVERLDMDPGRSTPTAGAIALGHPISATGAVIAAKCLSEMARPPAARG